MSLAQFLEHCKLHYKCSYDYEFFKGLLHAPARQLKAYWLSKLGLIFSATTITEARDPHRLPAKGEVDNGIQIRRNMPGQNMNFSFCFLRSKTKMVFVVKRPLCVVTVQWKVSDDIVQGLISINQEPNRIWASLDQVCFL